MPQPIFIALVLAATGVLYWWYQNKHKEGSNEDVKHGSILQTYTKDLTEQAKLKKLDPVIGRDKEIERVIHILTRRTKNNPLLLGEPGVGKTAVVEGIARRIVADEVPAQLRGKKVLALDLGGLISGTKYRGEFEQRMKKLTDEMKAMGRVVILFIDEVHMIEQAKGAEGAMNVSDILKPALSRGELQAIGATTWKEYEALIKPDDALNRRFQPVTIGEPSDEATLEILEGVQEIYEQYHHVTYDPKALKAAIELSAKRIPDRYLPDKAIDLIDEAGAKVSIETEEGTRQALGVLHAAGKQVRAETKKKLAEQCSKLQKELHHLQALEKTLADSAEVRKLSIDIQAVAKKLAAIKYPWKDDKKVPVVTEKDIASIVEEWMVGYEERAARIKKNK